MEKLNDTIKNAVDDLTDALCAAAEGMAALVKAVAVLFAPIGEIIGHFVKSILIGYCRKHHPRWMRFLHHRKHRVRRKYEKRLWRELLGTDRMV